MRIQVIGDDAASRQAMIYAEYRLFAALSEAVQTERVQGAVLVLRHFVVDESDRTLCAITVDTDDGNILHVTTAGDHPYEAINRAVERIRGGSWPSIARPPVPVNGRVGS